MTRQVAIQQFKEEQRDFLKQTKRIFEKRLQEQCDKLVWTIKQVLNTLREEAEKLEKRKLMFFYFSLLRVDILNRTYKVMVQGMDVRWYLDEEPVLVEFSLDFIFNVIHPMWDEMIIKSKKYMGKVNTYDISYIIQDFVMECNGLLAHNLRFMFRDIEENKDFEMIPKELVWYIRWGEYLGKSEIIACVDCIPKDQEIWDKSLNTTKQKEDELVATYWYDTKIADSECVGKLMYFIQFEKCELTDIKFDHANMSGARFRGCRFTGCSFLGTILRQAQFLDCTWERNLFEDADLTNATFQEEQLAFVQLDNKQLQTIFVEQRQMQT